MKAYLLSIVLLLAALLVSSCGGSGNGSSGIATPAGKSSLTMTIHWPVRATRLIPVDSQSITVTLTDSTDHSVGAQTVARPTSGNSSSTTFNNLTPGAITVTSSAFPNSDGTGVAQATGSVATTLVVNQMAHVTVTMADTISAITILVNGQPANATNTQLAVRSTAQLSISAVNSTNQVVLVSPATIKWSSASSTYFTVSSTGLVTAVLGGVPTAISVTETESGVKSSVTFNVPAAAANNTPSAIFQSPINATFFYSIGATGISEFVQNRDATLSPLSPATVPLAGPASNPGVSYWITPSYVYIEVLNGQNRVLEGFKFQANGQLTPVLSNFPIAGGPIGAVAGDLAGKYLYVPAQQVINQYLINADGSLTANGTYTLALPEGAAGFDLPTGAMVPISGSNLLVVNGVYESGDVNTADMILVQPDSSGHLTTVSQTSNQNTVQAIQMIQTSVGNGTFYAEGENDLTEHPSPAVTELYQVSDGGILDLGPVGTTHVNNQSLSLATGRGLLLTFSPGSNTVTPFEISGNGQVIARSPIGTLPTTIDFLEGTLGMCIAVNSDNEGVYIPNYKANSDSQFGVTGGGGLSPLSPATLPD